MTKYILSVLLVVFIMSSCENAIKDEAVSDKETPEKVVEEIVEPVHSVVNDNTTVNSEEDLIGYWVGWFMPDNGKEQWENGIYAGERAVWGKQNKITLSIDTIRNDSIISHSIVAGNFRPFKGGIKLNGRVYEINTSEPGDDKYDGNFYFQIEKNQDTIYGKWDAYKKIETPKRRYSLTKKIFEYNPNVELRNDFVDWMNTKTRNQSYDEGSYIEEIESYFTTTEKVSQLNPSADLITLDQVEKLTKADIYVLRNSIYAKHGYSFKKRALRVFFDSHDWYMPVHVNIKSELTDIEKKNIKLLLRYEKYAEEYYDEFGRG